MKCERKGCDRDCGSFLLARPFVTGGPSYGGFVVVEAPMREGHLVKMPFEWRCNLHVPPPESSCEDYGPQFLARFAAEFLKRLKYPPRTMAVGRSYLTPEEAAKLRQEFERTATSEITPLDVPIDVLLIDPDS
jgi:hypothetical protein